jgi:hypothetical protein
LFKLISFYTKQRQVKTEWGISKRERERERERERGLIKAVGDGA